MKEFCRAVIEAKIFLQDCCASDFWKYANSIIKLNTGEAYDVLLHNLIWSAAGFRFAILYAVAEHERQCTDCKKIEYDQCTVQISISSAPLHHQIHLSSLISVPAFRQRELEMDRADFYSSVENTQTQIYSNENEKKCLNFLVQKSKAYQQFDPAIFESAGAERAQNLDVFEIDPLDIVDEGDRLHFLGAGAFGEVYRRSWLGQDVAVKVFRGVPEEVFRNEASLLAGLQNPFIVGMVGWCKQKDVCMLVMELVHTDLKKVIDQSPARPFSPHAALDIMLQISRGMEYLHKRRVIHRDIKPKNVLLEPSSVREIAAEGHARVKLCDFGLAKVKDLSAEERSQYTTVNQGTSYYRAPEVLSNDEASDYVSSKYTRKADVFSFAITCSEILAGSGAANCYGRLNRIGLRRKMLANMRPNLPPDCPSHLVELIKSCWDTDPQRRPPFRRISRTLTYIKFILMRISDVPRVRYDSMVSPFDEDELKRRASVDEEFEAGDQRRSSGTEDEEHSSDTLDFLCLSVLFLATIECPMA